MCSCHCIPECCIMFSGVKLSMGSFILFMALKSKAHYLKTLNTPSKADFFLLQ